MSKRLSDWLLVYKRNDSDKLLKEMTDFDLTEQGLEDDQIKENWRFLGDNSSNNSTVAILDDPNKGVIERITNAIDAVIEREKKEHNIQRATTPNQIIRNSYPKLYNNYKTIMRDGGQLNAYESIDKVSVVFNDGSTSSRPTLDIIDLGTGIPGKNFHSTILSLQQGNKNDTNKNYLIGSFGQGGSTSLNFSHSTMIISKVDGEYYGTIVKAAQLKKYKQKAFMYVVEDAEVIKLVDDIELSSIEEHLHPFVQNKSGTMVRMIEAEISSEYRKSNVTKPNSMLDYIDIELFNVPMPIKVIDNRRLYKEQSSSQKRYAYGSYKRLRTSEHYNKDYSGTVHISLNNRPYEIEFYTILPLDESDWGSDSECRKIFKRFNIHGYPLIYTMNGQYVGHEYYTRFSNRGLLNLENRLLIHVNLDMLGDEKYSYVTSVRTSLQKKDATEGLFTAIVDAITENETLKELDRKIGEISVSRTIDQKLLNDLSSSLLKEYNEYVKDDRILKNKPRSRNKTQIKERDYKDVINKLEVTNSEESIFKDQQLNIHLITEAEKTINEDCREYITMYLNEKAYYDYQESIMRGRIQYAMGLLAPGEYKLHFEYVDPKDLSQIIVSNEYCFKVVDEKIPEQTKNKHHAYLDLDIALVEDRERILNIAKDELKKKINIQICLAHKDLIGVYSNKSPGKVDKLKQKLIKPIVMFGLFLEEYEELDIVRQNDMIASYIKSLINSEMIQV